MRWRAGNSEPGLTSKRPPVIWAMRRATPNPWRSPNRSDCRMRRSSVPCSSAVGSMQASYRATYRMSIGAAGRRSQVAGGEEAEGEGESDQQVQRGVGDHERARDTGAGERAEAEDRGQRRLHKKRRAAPEGFAGHDQAGEDADR